ncbi:MAG: YcxB family protein [Sphingomonadales bacterium]|nr:YcxB family protein [Sphingomonadales bacterium]
MQLSVSYASQRSEVRQWYWRVWRRSLWRIHLVIFVATTISASLRIYGGLPKGILAFSYVAAIGILPLIGMFLFPMWKFKPQVLTLRVDRCGIDTIIRQLSASVPWNEISDVQDEDDNLVIRLRNLNAFIVPARAFETREARTEFRDFVLEMVHACGSKPSK